MATTTQLIVAAPRHTTLSLWHLFSLDAPTVAALWTVFIARACRIHLSFATPAAIFLATWIVYVADRLLDARLLDARLHDSHPLGSSTLHTVPFPHRLSPAIHVMHGLSPAIHVITLEERHFFHHRHRGAFLIGIALASVTLAALLPLLSLKTFLLYLIEAALLAAWFLVLHAAPGERRLPKEIVVGLFFSATAFIPTVARAPTPHSTLAATAVLFAALCTLNCLFIRSWERCEPPVAPSRGPRIAGPTNAATRCVLHHLAEIALALTLASAAFSVLGRAPVRPVALAFVLSTLSLLALHRSRARLSRNHLRAAADLALLTPLLLLPFAR